MDNLKKLVEGFTPEQNRLVEIKTKISKLEKEATDTKSKDQQSEISKKTEELKKERDFLKNGGKLAEWGKEVNPATEEKQKESNIDNKTEKEASVEEIAEILKNNKIDQIIVAGENINKDKNSPEKIPGLLPDLDSKLALHLLSNYNKKSASETYNEGAAYSFINKDGSGKESIVQKSGLIIYIDTGGNWLKIEKEGETTTLYIDHHGVRQRAPTSGVKMTAEIMEKAGILKEKPEWLNKLIDFVNDVDNLNYLDKKDTKGKKVFTESYFRNEWPASLYALAEKKIPLKLLMELCEKGIIKDLTKPLTDEEINGEIGKIKVEERTIKDMYLAKKKIPLNLLMELHEKGIIKDINKPLTDEKLNGEIGKIKAEELTIKDICIEQRKEVSNTLDVGVKNSIKNNKDEGLNLEDTRLGRIIYHNHFKIRGASNKILDHLAFKATKAKGYDTFVNFNKKRKLFFLNSKNPNLSIVVEELNKKYPGCAIDIRGVMVYGKIVDSMTEEDFLNIIDPKILEGSKKVFKKEKQNDETGVAIPKDTEPAITPEEKDAEYEVRKAEIETKRQEEINKIYETPDSEIIKESKIYINFFDSVENTNRGLQKYHVSLNLTNHLDKYFKGGGVLYNSVPSVYIDDAKTECLSLNEVAKLYHKHKNEGTNPDLVKAVEEGLKAISEIELHKIKYEEFYPNKKGEVNAKYATELAELDKKYKKDQEKTSEEDPNEEATKKNTENSLLLYEKIREYKALKEEDEEADIKLAELLEMINQLPDDEEGENEEPQKTEGVGNDEENKEEVIEGSEIKTDEIEKRETYQEITKEDFTWAFPNYINRFGEFTIGDRLSITAEEFTHEQVKRNTLGRILNSSPTKTVKLKKSYFILKDIQAGAITQAYKLDSLDDAMIKTNEIIKEYSKKMAAEIGENTYVSWKYYDGKEKIENNILFFIKENITKAIEKDREEKPFFYYSMEKSNNKSMLNVGNKITNLLDMRRIEKDWVSMERKFMETTAGNEGFFEYNIFGFIKMIKNIKEITHEKEVSAKSDQAIYKIIGPDGKIIEDNIQGYDEATKIYWEKTNEYKKVVEEEFNRLNNKKR